MKTFMNIPRTTKSVPSDDIALVEARPGRDGLSTEVVMTSAGNGYVHETSATVDDVAAEVNAAQRDSGGVELVRVHDRLWVRPDLVACVETRYASSTSGRPGAPMLRVVMAAAGGGRPHDLIWGEAADDDANAHVVSLADTLVAHIDGRTATAAAATVEPDPELSAALGRLAWVVPGRNYDQSLIADVETVLEHFGLTNAFGGRTVEV